MKSWRSVSLAKPTRLGISIKGEIAARSGYFYGFEVELGVVEGIFGRLLVMELATFFPIQLLAPISACFPIGVITISKTTKMTKNFLNSDLGFRFDMFSLRFSGKRHLKIAAGNDIRKYSAQVPNLSSIWGGSQSPASVEASTVATKRSQEEG